MAFSRDLTPLGNFRRAFWMFYADRYPHDLQLRPGYARGNAFEDIGGLTISPYVSLEGVGVYVREQGTTIDTPRSERVQHCYALLEEQGAEHWKTLDATRRENWLEMADWMHETLSSFRDVVQSVIAPDNPAKTS